MWLALYVLIASLVSLSVSMLPEKDLRHSGLLLHKGIPRIWLYGLFAVCQILTGTSCCGCADTCCACCSCDIDEFSCLWCGCKCAPGICACDDRNNCSDSTCCTIKGCYGRCGCCNDYMNSLEDCHFCLFWSAGGGENLSEEADCCSGCWKNPWLCFQVCQHMKWDGVTGREEARTALEGCWECGCWQCAVPWDTVLNACDSKGTNGGICECNCFSCCRDNCQNEWDERTLAVECCCVRWHSQQGCCLFYGYVYQHDDFADETGAVLDAWHREDSGPRCCCCCVGEQQEAWTRVFGLFNVWSVSTTCSVLLRRRFKDSLVLRRVAYVLYASATLLFVIWRFVASYYAYWRIGFFEPLDDGADIGLAAALAMLAVSTVVGLLYGGLCCSPPAWSWLFNTLQRAREREAAKKERAREREAAKKAAKKEAEERAKREMEALRAQKIKRTIRAVAHEYVVQSGTLQRGVPRVIWIEVPSFRGVVDDPRQDPVEGMERDVKWGVMHKHDPAVATHPDDLNGERWLFKFAKKGSLQTLTDEEYWRGCAKTHGRAKHYARQFNENLPSDMRITINPLEVVTFDDGGVTYHCGAEPPLEPASQFVKYMNNKGDANEEFFPEPMPLGMTKVQWRHDFDVASAFSHYVLHATDNRVTFLDLQGVGRTLTDLAIVSEKEEGEAGTTDQGINAILNFRNVHHVRTCRDNPACKALVRHAALTSTTDRFCHVISLEDDDPLSSDHLAIWQRP